jgi:hypothetical protein
VRGVALTEQTVALQLGDHVSVDFGASVCGIGPKVCEVGAHFKDVGTELHSVYVAPIDLHLMQDRVDLFLETSHVVLHPFAIADSR